MSLRHRRFPSAPIVVLIALLVHVVTGCLASSPGDITERSGPPAAATTSVAAAGGPNATWPAGVSPGSEDTGDDRCADGPGCPHDAGPGHPTGDGPARAPGPAADDPPCPLPVTDTFSPEYRSAMPPPAGPVVLAAVRDPVAVLGVDRN